MRNRSESLDYTGTHKKCAVTPKKYAVFNINCVLDVGIVRLKNRIFCCYRAITQGNVRLISAAHYKLSSLGE